MVWRHDVYQSSLAVFFCHLQAAGSHAPLASVDLPHIQIRSVTIQLVTIHTFIAYKRELDSIYTYIQYIGIYNKENIQHALIQQQYMNVLVKTIPCFLHFM